VRKQEILNQDHRSVVKGLSP